MEANKVNCRGCKYFHITWDKASPYGCKAMGFKSKFMPSIIVVQTTGKACLSFHPKSVNK